MERGEAIFFARHKFGSMPRDAEKRIENIAPEELAPWGQWVLQILVEYFHFGLEFAKKCPRFSTFSLRFP
uniref:Uncharacterized protein n=1 Tax=Candidatus Kentrum sp. DK TaxID=2126562 RepID=A0A450S134_9GAMM|nr:MAG: hypothetical protein BECKDK2373B_GA0170837_101048 [Candidatus Kentron sp. DK]